jgi:hypothetical protein
VHAPQPQKAPAREGAAPPPNPTMARTIKGKARPEKKKQTKGKRKLKLAAPAARTAKGKGRAAAGTRPASLAPPPSLPGCPRPRAGGVCSPLAQAIAAVQLKRTRAGAEKVDELDWPTVSKINDAIDAAAPKPKALKPWTTPLAAAAMARTREPQGDDVRPPAQKYYCWTLPKLQSLLRTQPPRAPPVLGTRSMLQRVYAEHTLTIPPRAQKHDKPLSVLAFTFKQRDIFRSDDCPDGWTAETINTYVPHTLAAKKDVPYVWQARHTCHHHPTLTAAACRKPSPAAPNV